MYQQQYNPAFIFQDSFKDYKGLQHLPRALLAPNCTNNPYWEIIELTFHGKIKNIYYKRSCMNFILYRHHRGE